MVNGKDGGGATTAIQSTVLLDGRPIVQNAVKIRDPNGFYGHENSNPEVGNQNKMTRRSRRALSGHFAGKVYENVAWVSLLLV